MKENIMEDKLVEPMCEEKNQTAGKVSPAEAYRQCLRDITTVKDPKLVRRRVNDYIAIAMKELLDGGPEMKVAWRGTMTDLVELCHIAWFSGDFADVRGQGMTFGQMVRDVCRKLHCTPVQNPYSLIGRTLERKLVSSVTERYAELMTRGHIANPIALDLVFRG